MRSSGNRWCLILLVGAGLVCPHCIETRAEEPAAIVAALVARDGLPSLSVAVAREGAPLYAAAFGSADVENDVPATPETVYRIGSVSKTVTATAVMQLAEEGRLDLDRPIRSYCPAFPEKEALPTAGLLLAHLGGIRNYNYRRFREEFLSDKRHASLSDALSVFKDDALAAAPGEKHIYSSFGYVLLGCAVEGAAGVSFGDYLETNIFRAAGMERARLEVPEEIVRHRARPYSKTQEGELKNSPFVDLSDRYPAGGLLATPTDLVAFGRALLEGKLVEPATWAAMIERQKTLDGEGVEYGLGWRLSDPPGEVFHGGTSVGASAYLFIRVESGTVVALATNVDRWTEPRHELAETLASWAESR